MKLPFYYDLNAYPSTKKASTLFLVLGIVMLIISIVSFVDVMLDNDQHFKNFVTPFFQGLNGIIFILLATGKFYKKGQYYLNITEEAVAYRLPGAKPRLLPIDQIGFIFIATNYIFFKLKNGWQDTIEFNTLTYDAIQQFKAALETVHLEEGVLQRAWVNTL